VDTRSDIFSFGLVVYEMLSGKRAFSGDTPMATLAAIVKDEPAPFAAPEALNRIIRRCLAKQAAQRFQTMAEVRTALEQARQAGRVALGIGGGACAQTSPPFNPKIVTTDSRRIQVCHHARPSKNRRRVLLAAALECKLDQETPKGGCVGWHPLVPDALTDGKRPAGDLIFFPGCLAIRFKLRHYRRATPLVPRRL
jgi:hypothetical protein